MDLSVSLAAQGYEQVRPAVAADPRDGGMSAAMDWATSFADTLNAGEQAARAAMTGKADPHTLVQALASSQMAVETVSAVRDRVVSAYQEILRMAV